MPGDLVSTDWLAANLAAPNIAVLDCSWHLPAAKRDALAEYLAEHIPGALFCDLDQISDHDSALPHMLPAPTDFAVDVGAMGIGNDTQVICYDAAGLFSAARVWWMFKVFGHGSVSVLDGGLPRWKADGNPVEAGAGRRAKPNIFNVRFHHAMVADRAQVKSASQVADARSPPRFRGEEPEPRPGVRPGHIPGSRNLHYASLLNPDGTMKPPAAIAKLFADADLDITKPITTSCGSGVTAAILTLGLALIGSEQNRLYDGSWAEWGAALDEEVDMGV
jgi:thiosulfate/3-mercaptopyruvate sulfurtransferase